MLFLYLMVPTHSTGDGLRKNQGVSSLQMPGANCGPNSPLPPILSATCAMGHGYAISICMLYQSSYMYIT